MTRKSPNPAPEPKYQALRKKCKYCKLTFTTPATANGQKMEFCKPAHRWAFAREGSKPIDWVLKKQEKRMRQIAREEIAELRLRISTLEESTRMVAKNLFDQLIRTEQSPAAPNALKQSA